MGSNYGVVWAVTMAFVWAVTVALCVGSNYGVVWAVTRGVVWGSNCGVVWAVTVALVWGSNCGVVWAVRHGPSLAGARHGDEPRAGQTTEDGLGTASTRPARRLHGTSVGTHCLPCLNTLCLRLFETHCLSPCVLEHTVCLPVSLPAGSLCLIV